MTDNKMTAEQAFDDIGSCLHESDPEFVEFRDSIPAKHWSRYDLSAVRIGWHHGRRLLRQALSAPRVPECDKTRVELRETFCRLMAMLDHDGDIATIEEQEACHALLERLGFFINRALLSRVTRRESTLPASPEPVAQDQQVIADLRTEVEALRADRERLNAIERIVETYDGLRIHNGTFSSSRHVGIGLANTGRTLREAIDAARLREVGA